MRYRLSGAWWSAPDRGDNDGTWNQIGLDFEADDEATARARAKNMLRTGYSADKRGPAGFKNLKLTQLVEVDLGNVFD